MGMIIIKCPFCGATIEVDGSRDFGFCSYCGSKILLKNNGEEKQPIEKENTESLLQKAQDSMNAATIENEKVIEGLSYGRLAIENAMEQDRQSVSDQLIRIYINCMSRLGQEMVATIKTYNNAERHSVAIRQTHNVLKSMDIVPSYFQESSLPAITELENASVKIYRSLTGWAKQAAKTFNGNRAYCANIQKMSSEMRRQGSINAILKTPDNKPVASKPWQKKWWIWVILGLAFVLIISILSDNCDGSSKQRQNKEQEITTKTEKETTTEKETETTTEKETETTTEKETETTTEKETESTTEKEAETTTEEAKVVHDYSMYPADLQDYISRCEQYATNNISDSFASDYTFSYSTASAFTQDFSTVIISELRNEVPYVSADYSCGMEMLFINNQGKLMTFVFSNEYGGQLKLKYVYKEEYGSSPYKSPNGRE